MSRVMKYDTIVIELRMSRKIRGWVGSCTEHIAQEKDLINSNGKMETRHLVEGQFSCEFPAICNHCGSMTAWSRKTWKFCEQFLRFLEKRPLMVKFSKFCSEVYMATPINVVLKCRKICSTENWWNRPLFAWQKNSAPSQAVATARIAPKICQGQPPTFGSHYSRFHPNRFTFGGVITEHINTVLLPSRLFPIFAFGWIKTVNESCVRRGEFLVSAGKQPVTDCDESHQVLTVPSSWTGDSERARSPEVQRRVAATKRFAEDADRRRHRNNTHCVRSKHRWQVSNNFARIHNSLWIQRIFQHLHHLQSFWTKLFHKQMPFAQAYAMLASTSSIHWQSTPETQ